MKKVTKADICAFVMENWSETWIALCTGTNDEIDKEKRLSRWYSWDVMREFLGLERKL